MTIGSGLRAAVAACALVAAAPAMGQISKLDQLSDTQRTEIYCVRDELARDPNAAVLAAEAFIYELDMDKAELDAAEAVVKKAAEGCAARYKWDARKQELGMQAGFFVAVVDYLVEDLIAGGGAQAHVDAIDRAVVKLSKEDLISFADGSWMDDEALLKRVNTLLVAEKFPAGDEYNLETARLIIEAHVSQASAAWEWVQVYINKQ